MAAVGTALGGVLLFSGFPVPSLLATLGVGLFMCTDEMGWAGQETPPRGALPRPAGRQ